jgi:hypothetical protein
VKPRRTEKQKEIMGLILRSAGEGKFLTQKELHEAVSYKDAASYGAIRISINFLVNQGMLEKVRAGRIVELRPTERAYDWFKLRI